MDDPYRSQMGAAESPDPPESDEARERRELEEILEWRHSPECYEARARGRLRDERRQRVWDALLALDGDLDKAIAAVDAYEEWERGDV